MAGALVIASARSQRRLTALRSWSAYLLVLGLFVVLTGLAWLTAPLPFGYAAVAMVITGLAWLLKPVVGLHLTVFFALVGDAVTMHWFPFNKNLSSRESIMFVHDKLAVSPLEAVVGFALALTFARALAEGRLPARGPFTRPLLVYSAFIVFGFVHGVGRGGDMRIALYQVRPMLLMPLLYLLALEILPDLRARRRLMWTVVGAVVVQSLLSLEYYFRLTPTKRATLERLNEHGSSVAMATVLALVVTVLVIHGCSRRTRLVLLLAAVPVAWTFVLGQRRAAFVGLLVAIVMLFAVLFWRQRRTFVRAAPVTLLVGAAIVGATWNATGPISTPAAAVKSIVAPDQLTEEESSSNLYRVVENINLRVTVQSSPLLGIGFGQPFLRPIPLADISFFEFYQYIPHNSIIWIWTQTGFLGFATLVFLLVRAVMLGALQIRRAPPGADLATTAAATFHVMIFSIFAFVDIAWDQRNTIALAIMMALVSTPRPAPEPAKPSTPPDGGRRRTDDERESDPPSAMAADDQGAEVAMIPAIRSA